MKKEMPKIILHRQVFLLLPRDWIAISGELSFPGTMYFLALRTQYIDTKALSLRASSSLHEYVCNSIPMYLFVRWEVSVQRDGTTMTIKKFLDSIL
jgi:hypothetical protein